MTSIPRKHRGAEEPVRKAEKLLREFEETSTDENQVKRKSFWDKVKDALKDK